MSDLAEHRRRLLGAIPTFHGPGLELVRGRGVEVWDAQGRRYLDCYNHVPHVGHCHPRVVEAIARQAAELNLNTRYLHRTVLDYAERLLATFAGGPWQALFVNSASEANDVALRMAQAATGRTGFVATDNTYHGSTAAVSQLSAQRPPIGGYAGHVRLIPAPDGSPGQAQLFARNLTDAIVELEEQGSGFAALILDPVLANEGLPALEPGVFGPALGVVRRARGLVVADEAQPGFGRTGAGWWGHAAMDLAPDIVTLGKGMANGHPVAGVVARPEVMADFRDACAFFSTFGGNPVSMAAALAVLEVIEAEALIANARDTGARLLAQLRGLRHPRIAEVRGRGLLLAVEFAGPEPAAFAARVVQAMAGRGVLTGTGGRHGQILKLRPPMPFSAADADEAAGKLAEVLAGLA